MAVATTETTWWRRASCRGTKSAYFVPPTTREQPRDCAARESTAKSICADCSVRADCLEYALRVNERLGIWGGLNEGEREQIAFDAERRA